MGKGKAARRDTQDTADADGKPSVPKSRLAPSGWTDKPTEFNPALRLTTVSYIAKRLGISTQRAKDFLDRCGIGILKFDHTWQVNANEVEPFLFAFTMQGAPGLVAVTSPENPNAELKFDRKFAAWVRSHMDEVIAAMERSARVGAVTHGTRAAAVPVTEPESRPADQPRDAGVSAGGLGSRFLADRTNDPRLAYDQLHEERSVERIHDSALRFLPMCEGGFMGESCLYTEVEKPNERQTTSGRIVDRILHGHVNDDGTPKPDLGPGVADALDDPRTTGQLQAGCLPGTLLGPAVVRVGDRPVVHQGPQRPGPAGNRTAQDRPPLPPGSGHPRQADPAIGLQTPPHSQSHGHVQAGGPPGSDGRDQAGHDSAAQPVPGGRADRSRIGDNGARLRHSGSAAGQGERCGLGGLHSQPDSDTDYTARASVGAGGDGRRVGGPGAGEPVDAGPGRRDAGRDPVDPRGAERPQGPPDGGGPTAPRGEPEEGAAGGDDADSESAAIDFGEFDDSSGHRPPAHDDGDTFGIIALRNDEA